MMMMTMMMIMRKMIMMMMTCRARPCCSHMLIALKTHTQQQLGVSLLRRRSHHVRRGLGKSETQWNQEAEIGKAGFLAVGRACRAIIWPTPVFKERFLRSHAFSAKGTSVSAFAMPTVLPRMSFVVNVYMFFLTFNCNLPLPSFPSFHV